MTQIQQMNETQVRQALTAVQLRLAEAQTQFDQARSEHEQVKLQSREAADSLRDLEEELESVILDCRLAADQVNKCREASGRLRYFEQFVDQQRHLCDGELEFLRIQAAQFDEAQARLRSFCEQRQLAAVKVIRARSAKTDASSGFRRSQDAFVKALAIEEFARQMLQAAGLQQ
jgi:hypothetical protein